MYYLGVDGGGTKTAFILIDEKGKVPAYLTKSTCHYIQAGIENFEIVLREGIEKLCELALIDISDIKYSFLGLPAYGENVDDIPGLEKIVRDILNSERFRCGNDVEAGWAGSLACQPGINLVGGTGAIGFGRDDKGNSARASGWGYFCGDEGSAYWLGRKVISLFGKEADGRMERTPIYNIVRESFNIERDLDFITVVYDELEMKRDKIAGLALLLDKAAEEGDENAIKYYREAAYEHSLTVKALLNKLEFNQDKEILVSYSGGVFKAGSHILEPLKEFIDCDQLKLIKPILEPVTGAALYGLVIDKQIASYDSIISSLKKEEKRLGL